MDEFARRLLAWFEDFGRKDLPWQRQRTPYRVWVSEIMLQQTQVATVIPYFERFMARFPSLPALAAAEPDDVMALWSGLGYYTRARNLHTAARQVMEAYGGDMPENLEALMALPGIGRSTAGAILAQSFGQRQPILDGNVKRVLARYHAIEGWPGSSAVQRRLWALADAHTPDQRLADYTQAIMDLGATLCRRRQPRCAACPVGAGCEAHQTETQDRYPFPKPRKALPTRETLMLVITDGDGRLLLHRRPPTGIWGGLWSLPECRPGQEPREWCREQLGLETTRGRPGQGLMHTFSHFRLAIATATCRVTAAREVREPGSFCWDLPEEVFARGLPAPVRQLLQDMLAPGAVSRAS